MRKVIKNIDNCNVVISISPATSSTGFSLVGNVSPFPTNTSDRESVQFSVALFDDKPNFEITPSGRAHIGTSAVRMLRAHGIALDLASYYVPILEDVVSTRDVSPMVIDAMKAADFDLAALLVDMDAYLGERKREVVGHPTTVLDAIVRHPAFAPVESMLPDFLGASIGSKPRTPAYPMAESVLAAFMALHPAENDLKGDAYWQYEVARLIDFIRR